MVIIALFLVATVVYYIVSDIEFLNTDENPMSKYEIYNSILFTQWALVGILVVLWALIDIPYTHLFFWDPSVGMFSWLENSNLMWGIICGSAVALVVLPFLKQSSKKNIAVEKIEFKLPNTLKERLAFLLIAITAGICEEIIFRGAATYFFMNLPYDLPLWLIGLLGAVLFGLAHWFQGISGVLIATVVGVVLFFVYVQTGSLLLPMLLHFLIDVKFVFMPDWRKRSNGGEIGEGV